MENLLSSIIAVTLIFYTFKNIMKKVSSEEKVRERFNNIYEPHEQKGVYIVAGSIFKKRGFTLKNGKKKSFTNNLFIPYEDFVNDEIEIKKAGIFETFKKTISISDINKVYLLYYKKGDIIFIEEEID